MKNFTKILCVVLALVMALSVASCSLSKQYAYQKDGVELPIGVYVYYMYSAYNEAQTLAQKSDLYDAATGKYDGKKSFLKIEITDEDGNTAVAEDWITDKTKEKLQNAVAIETKFNELGCTVDQAELYPAGILGSEPQGGSRALRRQLRFLLHGGVHHQYRREERGVRG